MNEARAASARARLDAIVHATGTVDTEQAAFAGLASASGLGGLLYRGWGNRPLRKRLDQIAKGRWTGSAAPAADAPTQAAGGAAARAATAHDATDEATQGATQAASDAAVRSAAQAATDAAVQAATQAATGAAVAAAVHAAHHAAATAHSAGAGGGGHH